MKDFLSSRRLAGLDVLRALAALCILVCHVMHIGRWLAGPVAFPIGQMGRRLFLVLSSFLLFLPYARAAYAPAASRRKISIANYALKRALRLLPLYVTAVLAFAALGFLRGWPHNAKNLLYHLLFIHIYDQSTFFGLAGPLWFIGVIAHWYVLLPFVGWAWLKLKNRLAIWIGLTLAMTVAYASAWIWLPTTAAVFKTVFDKGLLGSLPFLFAGMTAAACFIRLRERRQSDDPLFSIAVVLPAAIVLIGALVAFCLRGGHHASPLVLGALAFGFANATSGGRVLAPLRGFARMSYSVYIWHTAVLIGLTWFAPSLWEIASKPVRVAAIFGTAIIPILLVSYVSFRVLEAPFLKLKVTRPRRRLTQVAVAYSAIVLASAVLFFASAPSAGRLAEETAAEAATPQPAAAAAQPADWP